MPRGGGGRPSGGSRGSSPSRSSFAASKPQPAQSFNQAPMQQAQTAPKQGMFSGIGSTIMQGMAFGAGS